MKKHSKVAAAVVAGLGLTLAVGGCSQKADVASHNLSVAADNFQVDRQIVFYNGITGAFVAEVDGLCSLGNSDPSGQLSVTCKVGPDKYIKDFLGLSDNVTYFVLQTRPEKVSTSHYRVIFRPSTVVPNVGVQ